MAFTAKRASGDVKKDVSSNAKLQTILNYIKLYSKATCRFHKTYKNDDEIMSYNASREGRKIFKYGEFIAACVTDFIESGHLEQVEQEWLNSTCEIIRLLSKIEGMGPIRAAELVEQGINSIDELFCNTDKLTRQQLVGLEHFADLNVKIPLSEVTELFQKMSNMLAKENYTIFISGPGRRSQAKCTQIDCLLVSNNANAIEEAVEILKPIIVNVVCLGSTKFKGICRLDADSPARRLTIRSALATQFPFLLLYHTGPVSFIKKLTKDGLTRGFKLFEHSMRKLSTNESIAVSSEEEIFNHLGVEYVPPQSR